VRSLRVAIACCLLVTAVAPAAGAGGIGATADQSIVVSYTFAPADAPDRVRVTVRLTSLPAAVSRFRFSPQFDGVRTVDRRGFTREDGDFVWDGRTETPSITYTAPAAPDARSESRGTERGANGLGTADAEDWTYVATGRLTFPYAYRYFGTDPGVETRIAAEGGTTGASVAFLGEYTTATQRTGDQRFRLVVPDAATFDATARERVFATLRTARRDLEVGAVDDRVTVFVTTAPIRRGGVTFPQRVADAQNVWVRDDVPVDATSNTWIHEYVHTRQSYDLAPELGWFTEASAEYYAALLTLHQGRIDYDAFHDHVTVDRHAADRLADQSTWTRDRTPYTKGRRVLAALDARIRTESDGTATLEDVFRRLNDHGGTVTYRDFVEQVNGVAGTDLSDWLDRHVRGTVAPPVPDDRYTFVDPTVADTDGDGLDDDRERALGTSPFTPDTDDDGLSDVTEHDGPTDATRADTDGDGLADGRERELGTRPLTADTDDDGVVDGRELDAGTNPTARDTDSDGLDDDRELDGVSDPAVFDTDDDGLADGRELDLGTDPTARDTDDDGLTDPREIRLGTDPTTPFTDADRLTDAQELNVGTDPTARDTDDDGLGDARERRLGLDPTDPDVDGDGIEDGREVKAGTDPQVKTSGIVFFVASLF
jgi:hypothetical protein